MKFCAKLVSKNVHIRELIGKIIIDITKNIYMNFQEFFSSYRAKNNEKLI
jgi:hypothetical protein